MTRKVYNIIGTIYYKNGVTSTGLFTEDQVEEKIDYAKKMFKFDKNITKIEFSRADNKKMKKFNFKGLKAWHQKN